MATCTVDHTGEIPKKLSNLPESQAGALRHKCAACAYEQGLADGARRARAEQKHLHPVRSAR